MSNTGSDKIDSSIDEKVDEPIDSPINASVDEVNSDVNAHRADSESINQTHDFGRILSQARIEQNYSIAEVNEQIKVPHHVLQAIEASDIAALPAPTFTQGYIHNYAKFLEISEDNVLALYRRAIHGNNLSSLRPRSTLSKKSSSRFPLIKIALILLVVVSVLILIYNGLQSDDTTELVEADLVGGELASAENSISDDEVNIDNAQKIEIKQQARLTEEGELLLDKNNPNNQQAGAVSNRPVSNRAVSNNDTVDKVTVIDTTAIETESEADADVSEAAAEADASEIVVTEINNSAVGTTDATDVDSSTVDSTESTTAIESAENTTQSEQLEIDLSDIVPDTEIIDPGNDTISFFAELEAWVDVRDANDTQLYYNMLPEGGSRTFTGLAPFSVTIGNARTIIVEVNNIEVNLSRRIRSTNTATFTVSTNKKRVIFHKSL